MEYCAGGDLTNYIKKRGRVEGLEYVPHLGAPPQYFPQPRTGGLTEIVVRSFLRQLGTSFCFFVFCVFVVERMDFDWMDGGWISEGVEVPSTTESYSSR